MTLDPVRWGLLIAHGLGDSAAVSQMANEAACIRMMTPAVPVALEMCQGSADGEDHKLGAKMGTVKGGRASATTKHAPVLQAACGREHTILLRGPANPRRTRALSVRAAGQGVSKGHGRHVQYVH